MEEAQRSIQASAQPVKPPTAMAAGVVTTTAGSVSAKLALTATALAATARVINARATMARVATQVVAAVARAEAARAAVARLAAAVAPPIIPSKKTLNNS